VFLSSAGRLLAKCCRSGHCCGLPISCGCMHACRLGSVLSSQDGRSRLYASSHDSPAFEGAARRRPNSGSAAHSAATYLLYLRPFCFVNNTHKIVVARVWVVRDRWSQVSAAATAACCCGLLLRLAAAACCCGLLLLLLLTKMRLAITAHIVVCPASHLSISHSTRFSTRFTLVGSTVGSPIYGFLLIF